ncbi:MAG TPA: MarR family transcriptional regulator [Acidimicrobiales bacterium]|nr:MarR family transcriptional regulator [Acidimicrobiales bacterium]
MRTIPSGEPGRRRLLQGAIRSHLRELGIELSLLNHHVGAHLGLSDVDLGALNVIQRHGPLSPSALAMRCGLHPATTTGVIDRLERSGWIGRERDLVDRRGVLLRFDPRRGGEMARLYGGMNASVRRILAECDVEELRVVERFLERTVDASRQASSRLEQR